MKDMERDSIYNFEGAGCIVLYKKLIPVFGDIVMDKRAAKCRRLHLKQKTTC